MTRRNITKRKAFKHEEITEQILENIRNGNLVPGDKLPSLRQLSKDMKCNYLTVYRSFEELERMGLLEKRTGSGTYVKQTAINISDGNSKKSHTPLTHTGKLGLMMIPGQGGPYMSGLLEALHRIASDMDITLNLRTVSEYSTRNIAQVQSLRAQECCAVIIPWWPREQDLGEIHKLVNLSMVPIVLPQSIHGLAKHSPSRPFSSSNKDSKTHCTRSCEYFKALGYKNIALLGTDSETENGPFQRMMMDYTRFVNKHQMQNYIGLLDDISAADYDRIVDNWKTLAGDLAVVCYFDKMAIRLMTAAHKAGLKIPEDIAVLGYNNITEAEFSDPPLSTIQCPYEAIAENMILHALSMCGDDTREKKYIFEEKFIIRESCGGKARKSEERG